jgi:hypothetical protein
MLYICYGLLSEFIPFIRFLIFLFSYTLVPREYNGNMYRNTANTTDSNGAPADVRGTLPAIDQGTRGAITTALFSRYIANLFLFSSV